MKQTAWKVLPCLFHFDVEVRIYGKTLMLKFAYTPSGLVKEIVLDKVLVKH
jgi:hypothetical protein